MGNDRFQQAIAKIDAANAEDPSGLATTHAERRMHWIQQLQGGSASEALRLAARAQHIRRWQVPRSSYPDGRTGYLNWRDALQRFHAEQTAEILRETGYDDETIERVQALIQKKRLKLDPETQALEDALCLVFLETQFTEFAKKEGEKIGNIIRKTWRKMSPQGQELALQLPLSEEDRAIIEGAVTK